MRFVQFPTGFLIRFYIGNSAIQEILSNQFSDFNLSKKYDFPSDSRHLFFSFCLFDPFFIGMARNPEKQ